MRKMHRWVSLPAFLFLLVVAVTGVLLQATQLFGEDESEREKQAAASSPFTLASWPSDLGVTVETAIKSVVETSGKAAADIRLNGVDFQYKADPPRIIIHAALGAGEGERFTVNAKTGVLLSREKDGESLLLRIHTGEVLGDPGVALGLFWGTALVVLASTGAWLYWKMYRARAGVKGWKKVLW